MSGRRFQLLLVLIAGWTWVRPPYSAEAASVSLGPVTASVAVTPAEPVIGDIITLEIEVIAESEVEVLMPEFGEALDRFSIVDFVPRQQIDPSGKTVSSQKYRLQPVSSGPQSVPPILIEFVDRRQGQRQAPEGQDAYELFTPRIDFDVQSVLPADASHELKPPLGELSITKPLTQTWGWWAAVTGLLITCGAVMFFWLRRRQQPAPQLSAYETAKRRLHQLRNRPLPAREEIDPFFVELSDIVRTYLERRFNLRAPELTTEEFLEVASASPDLSRAHQQTLRSFLQQADLVKFAGLQPPEEEMRKALDAADHFLEDTRIETQSQAA